MKKILIFILAILMFISYNPRSYAQPINPEEITIAYLSTAEDFLSIKDDEADVFILKNDIDLEFSQWTPIENFNKKLYGNGYTIKNFNSNNLASALFNNILENGLIENLTIEGVVRGVTCAANFAVRNFGKISQCNGSSSITSMQYAASIAIYNYGTISNCCNKGKIMAKKRCCGIATFNRENGCISESLNTKEITSNRNSAGITCFNQGIILRCKNDGGISAPYNAAGINNLNVGYIQNCKNCETIRANYAAGISNYDFKEVTQCENYGKINGVIFSGEIICYNQTGDFDNYENDLYGIICYDQPGEFDNDEDD